MRVLFFGYFEYNSGSSNTLLGYHRAAVEQAWDLRLSPDATCDAIVREGIPVAPPEWRPDVAVLVFESNQFMSGEALERLDRLVPRRRRVLIDPDGKYSERVQVGRDANHLDEASRVTWRRLYEGLTDVILQPSIADPAVGAHRFLYFGVDAHRRPPRIRPEFDLLYVGNNWYRWHDMVWLLDSVRRHRESLGRIALFGKHWHGDPKPGLEEHTFSDSAYLEEIGVETYRSAAFGTVEATMARGRLHPILVRPVINEMQMVTPRMFETFASGTVPLLPRYFRHAEALYGPHSGALRLDDEPAETVVRALKEYPAYRRVAREIRRLLRERHSYEVRLRELTEFV